MNARQFGILASLVIHGGLYAGVMYFGRLPDKPVTAGVETALTISMFDAIAATPSPEPVEPEPVEPEPVEPEPVEPEPVEPEPVEPEPVKPEPVKPEPVKPEPVKPEPVKPEPVKPDASNQPVTTAVVESAASKAADDLYVASIRAAIAKHRTYPRKARRKKQQGIVQIAFRVLADGEIQQLRVVQSSGVDSLDQAALNAVRKVGRFASFPEAMAREFRDFELPVAFQLR